jgi:DNA-binding CsgD family transcriptional regulator
MEMTQTTASTSERSALRRNLFLAASALQVGCGLVFITDVVSEWGEFDRHTLAEVLGIIALLIGAAVSLAQYRHLLRRNTKIERELGAASGAFQDVIEQHFDNWHLTEAERDVAILSIKGVPIADIAAMRHTRAGTIKAQSAAIYRKAGVSSRAELITVMIEELIAGIRLRGPDGANDKSNR